MPTLASVLVVDDHRDTADTAADLLAAAGCEARAAYTCTDALVTAAALRPQVVLLDLDLPDGDGYGLAARLERVLGYRPAFGVITGRDGQERRSADAGFAGHLTKPAGVVDMLALVAHARAVEPAAPHRECPPPPAADRPAGRWRVDPPPPR